MKILHFWLPVLAAITIAAPLRAADITAQTPHQQNTAAVEAATVNWPRVAWDAEKVAEKAAENAPGEGQSVTPNLAQNIAPQAPASAAAKPDSPPAPAEQPSSLPVAKDENQHDKAEVQLREQEHQRVMGILPSFNVSYRMDAVSLTGWQKMRLAFHSSVDPFTFATAFLVAGYHEADNDLAFGWGFKGYEQRVGAAYLDTFNGNMIGNGILPALLHQDPRYFRLGHGGVAHRLLYAAAAGFMCKHDNTGKWEPNYSNVLGNVAAGAISNLYYPGSNSGVGLTISNGMIVTAEGAFGAIFQEFWPDISRKLFHKDPTHGVDAETSPADKSSGR